MNFTLHEGDLPEDLIFGGAVAVDTETMGLNLHRDRLCLVQLSGGDGHAHLVRIAPGQTSAPHLKALFEDTTITKIFHFARFDVAKLKGGLGISCTPVYCTKIASRLGRTSTDRHGLKDLVRDLLGIEISKQQQTSDWGAAHLTDEQMAYAASDVLYLHRLRDKLEDILAREGRTAMAHACFDFLPVRADLDLAGWPETDIFAH